jgi:hypothetical protein
VGGGGLLVFVTTGPNSHLPEMHKGSESAKTSIFCFKSGAKLC